MANRKKTQQINYNKKRKKTQRNNKEECVGKCLKQCKGPWQQQQQQQERWQATSDSATTITIKMSKGQRRLNQINVKLTRSILHLPPRLSLSSAPSFFFFCFDSMYFCACSGIEFHITPEF